MMNNNCWLPNLEYYEQYNSWPEYQNALYEIFKSDFINDKPIFKGKRVNIRKYPTEHGIEEAFFHITCQDYLKNGNRVPDFRRCERIRWVRAFIENYNCARCQECDGIKIWSEPYKNTFREHLLLEEERYIVILEQRNNYYLLITAFYLEHDHTLNKQLQRFNACNIKN